MIMSALGVVLVPPLFFATRGRWGAAFVNGFFYLLSFPLLMFAGFGVLTWLFCVMHAGYYFRQEQLAAHEARLVTNISSRLTEEMRQQVEKKEA